MGRVDELHLDDDSRLDSVFRLEGVFHDKGYVVERKMGPVENKLDVYEPGEEVARFVGWFKVRRDKYIGTVHINSKNSREFWTIEAGIDNARKMGKVISPIKEEYNARTSLREVR